MLPKIKDIVWRTLKAIQETQEQKSNCFEIYGFDFMLDQKLKPWMLEVNHTPSFNADTAVDEDVKRKLIRNTLEIL